jgi:S-adenosyl-L-methionine hydrolase (adenosine-forming)
VHIITLTTDFGTRDWFVGTMKGIMLGINSRAAIVDLTHEIPPGDIRAGAFALMAGCRYFPKGTVHMAVVDPGVGSQRQAIAVQTVDYFFVGPDNGVLSWALPREKIKAIRQLDNPKYFLKTISRTFHGRDIFAPVAAHLSRGLSLERLGRELKDFVRLPWLKPTRQRGEICGEILYIDHFGNAITNIEAVLVSGRRKVTCEVIGRRKVRCPLAAFYGAVPANSPVAVIGSSGFLEIAVNGSSAAQRFGLKIGNALIVRMN